MTFDRVKEILSKNKVTADLDISYEKDSNGEIVDIEFDSPAHIEYILNLIDKDTPKEFVYASGGQVRYGFKLVPCCPTCGESVHADGELCNHCGQRLDWGQKNGDNV